VEHHLGRGEYKKGRVNRGKCKRKRKKKVKAKGKNEKEAKTKKKICIDKNRFFFNQDLSLHTHTVE
jgi:hypothetical protein